MTDDIVSTARAFLEREGRLVERRLAAVLFDGADPAGVVDAVVAYRNADGGFGHGLEPDKRCPASLPIDVEAALEILVVARDAAQRGSGDHGLEALGRAACDWLGSVATSEGAVPLAFPVMESYPRADHWSDWTYAPGLNPTAGLAGRMHRIDVEHAWLDAATEWTWARLESGFDEDAHALAEVLVFLAHVPDQGRAAGVGRQVGTWLATARWYRPDPADPDYGVTPLHLAPTPDSPWRRLFDDATVEAHLDRLVRDQQPDGGWAITGAAAGARLHAGVARDRDPPGAADTPGLRSVVIATGRCAPSHRFWPI